MRSTIQAATDDDIPSGATWAYGVDRTGGMAIGIATDNEYVYKPWMHDGQWYDRSRYTMNLDSVDLTLAGCGAVPLLLESQRGRSAGYRGRGVDLGSAPFRKLGLVQKRGGSAGAAGRPQWHPSGPQHASPYVGSAGVVVDEQPTPGRPGKNTCQILGAAGGVAVPAWSEPASDRG